MPTLRAYAQPMPKMPARTPRERRLHRRINTQRIQLRIRPAQNRQVRIPCPGIQRRSQLSREITSLAHLERSLAMNAQHTDDICECGHLRCDHTLLDKLTHAKACAHACPCAEFRLKRRFNDPPLDNCSVCNAEFDPTK